MDDVIPFKTSQVTRITKNSKFDSHLIKDLCLQNEIKNYWKSADDVRKAKDDVNGHKEKAIKSHRKSKSSAHHPTLCKDCAQSNKCNLQKVSQN